MSSLCNVTTGIILAAEINAAQTFWQRTIGLMGRNVISSDEGLWIEQCSAVHTMGMQAPIDIVFLNRQGYVLRILRSVKPNISQVACPLAYTVVETGEAAHLGHDLLVGDQLALLP